MPSINDQAPVDRSSPVLDDNTNNDSTRNDNDMSNDDDHDNDASRTRIPNDKLDLIWPDNWRDILRSKGVSWRGYNALGMYIRVHNSLIKLTGKPATKQDACERVCDWVNENRKPRDGEDEMEVDSTIDPSLLGKRKDKGKEKGTGSGKSGGELARVLKASHKLGSEVKQKNVRKQAPIDKPSSSSGVPSTYRIPPTTEERQRYSPYPLPKIEPWESYSPEWPPEEQHRVKVEFFPLLVQNEKGKGHPKSLRFGRPGDIKRGERVAPTRHDQPTNSNLSFETTWTLQVRLPPSYRTDHLVDPDDDPEDDQSETSFRDHDLIVWDLPPCLPTRKAARDCLAGIFHSVNTAARPEGKQNNSIFQLHEFKDHFQAMSESGRWILPVVVYVRQHDFAAGRMDRNMSTQDAPLNVYCQVEQLNEEGRWILIGERMSFRSCLENVLDSPSRQTGRKVSLPFGEIEAWSYEDHEVRTGHHVHREAFGGFRIYPIPDLDVNVDEEHSTRPRRVTWWSAGSFDYRDSAFVGTMVTMLHGWALICAQNRPGATHGAFWEIGVLGPESTVTIPFGQDIVLIYLTDAVTMETEWNHPSLVDWFSMVVDRESKSPRAYRPELARSLRMLCSHRDLSDYAKAKIQGLIKDGIRLAPYAQKKGYRDLLDFCSKNF